MSAGTYLGLCLSLLVIRVSLGSAGKAEQVLNAAVLYWFVKLQKLTDK